MEVKEKENEIYITDTIPETKLIVRHNGSRIFTILAEDESDRTRVYLDIPATRRLVEFLSKRLEGKE